jgi:23S rRNA (uracil1939-C5)-methyltransferase
MAKLKLQIPILRGDRLKLEVETLASSGDGIAHYEGYTIFVPQGVPGDSVFTYIEKTTPRFGIARILDIIQPSPNRIEPFCLAFPKCGGCKLQFHPYEKQMEFKTQVLKDNLQRIGKLDILPDIQALPAEESTGSRNKAAFAVQKNAHSRNMKIGFYRSGSHEVIDSPVCDALQSPLNQTKEIIRRQLDELGISLYDEKNHKGFLRGIIIRSSKYNGDTLVGFVTTRGKFPKGFIEDTAEKITEAGVRLIGIGQNINSKKTNVILGANTRNIWGENYIEDKLGDLHFHLSLPSFFQVNSSQAERLYNLIEDWVGLEGGLVLDAFCGVGTIALWLARKGRQVIGIEEFQDAVEDAIASAELNNIDSCQFLTGTVESQLKVLESDSKEINTVIVDPPRKGCSPEVIKSILKLAPQKIVYISCNPSTLARDLSLICEKEYKISQIYAADMFPQTQHVESAVLMENITNL